MATGSDGKVNSGRPLTARRIRAIMTAVKTELNRKEVMVTDGPEAASPQKPQTYLFAPYVDLEPIIDVVQQHVKANRDSDDHSALNGRVNALAKFFRPWLMQELENPNKKDWNTDLQSYIACRLTNKILDKVQKPGTGNGDFELLFPSIKNIKQEAKPFDSLFPKVKSFIGDILNILPKS